jgi:hypothetical protein
VYLASLEFFEFHASESGDEVDSDVVLTLLISLRGYRGLHYIGKP